MKKAIYTLLLVLPIFIMARLPERSSSGAPAGHTGAPGENTCATVGCHDDNSINSGTALLDIDLGNAKHYMGGKTYAIKIRISDPSVERFGFQLVAIYDKDSTNAGTFQLTDALRTQTVKSQYKFKDREYVTYTYDGTDAVTNGAGEWTVNWTAPAIVNGNVTFYASAVSANDDESDQGDHVYTKATKLSAFYKVTNSEK